MPCATHPLNSLVFYTNACSAVVFLSSVEDLIKLMHQFKSIANGTCFVYDRQPYNDVDLAAAVFLLAERHWWVKDSMPLTQYIVYITVYAENDSL